MNVLQENIVRSLKSRGILSAYTLIIENFGYEATKDPNSYDVIAENCIELQEAGKILSLNNGFGEYTYKVI